MALPLKDRIITEVVAPTSGIDEATCYLVVNWAFTKAREAVREKNSVEISGFGCFYVSNYKAIKKLNKLVEDLDNLVGVYKDTTKGWESRRESLTSEISLLKHKLAQANELTGSVGGVEEPSSSP